MSKIIDPEKRDVEECKDKIQILLAEYNCEIVVDSDFPQAMIVDIDNFDFDLFHN